MNQRSAPVLEALARIEKRPPTGFGAPGHAAGRAATRDVLKLVGRRAFQADVLTPKGLDERSEQGQVVQRAHALAAQAWGADLCRFSTGGSTQSLHAALAVVARPGEKILLAQNAHKAEFAASVFAGLDIAVLTATRDRAWGVEHGVSAATLERALAEHPDAKAALVVSPSYHGVTSDIAALARICHARGVPLIVDAAWGAAFGFNDRLPLNPLKAGADIVVVSVHKTMAALAQGSAMLLSGDLVDRERFALGYELFETTSPSVAILASLDATRREHALHGRRIWNRVLALAARTRRDLAAVPGIRVLGRERLDGDGAFDLDASKITFDVSGLGVNGYAADDWLKRRQRISVALSDARNLMVVFSPGVTARAARKLVEAVGALSTQARRHPHAFEPPPREAPDPGELGFDMVIPAPAAFAAETEQVAYEDAAGRIAAEILAPAPPGIPRLIPGQRITPAHVAYLVANRDAGVFMLDPADPSQHRLRVVKAG